MDRNRPRQVSQTGCGDDHVHLPPSEESRDQERGSGLGRGDDGSGDGCSPVSWGSLGPLQCHSVVDIRTLSLP